MRILEQEVLFDSHSHLNREEFNQDRDDVVSRAQGAGVEYIVDVATDLERSRQSLALAQKYPGIVYPTIGLHPDRFMPGNPFFSKAWSKVHDDLFIEMRELIDQNDQFVMIGECGIDYYWLEKMNLEKTDMTSSKDLQLRAFEEQVMIASEYDIPLTIHARDAFDDCARIMEKYVGKVDAVFHSFTGNYKQLVQIFDMGYKIGINGIITFKSAIEPQEALKKYLKGAKVQEAKDLYEKNIFLETDAPFLSPGKFRGNRNESSYLPETLDFIISTLCPD